ncbi:MAG: PEP-CTERM sorting domain-containing protein [Acidobacteria bacterium]|nr:PEP-CTERM sorting domain-containing protein [Acidobacteriota bacterium]
MSYKAHNRFLISASLIITFAAVAIGVFQGSANERSIAASDNVCSERFVISNKKDIQKPQQANCVENRYDPEPFTMLMFGIGLTGFAYGARRHFIGSADRG